MGKLAAMTNKAEFWACNGQCKSLFEGDQTHKVDPEKLMQRKKNLVAKGKKQETLCHLHVRKLRPQKRQRTRWGRYRLRILRRDGCDWWIQTCARYQQASQGGC